MNNDCGLLHTGIALLEQNRIVHKLSLFMTFLVLTILMLPMQLTDLSSSKLTLFLVVAFIGLMELVTSVHINFDIKLLESLDNYSSKLSDEFELMDRSLIDLSLMNESLSGRDLLTRINGCIVLLKRQVVLCLSQFFILILAVLINT